MKSSKRVHDTCSKELIILNKYTKSKYFRSFRYYFYHLIRVIKSS